jgi:hypothetical protein
LPSSLFEAEIEITFRSAIFSPPAEPIAIDSYQRLKAFMKIIILNLIVLFDIEII